MTLPEGVYAISGGTGSFGSTMTQHLLDAGASEVRVFSRDEEKQDTLRRRLRDSRLRFFLADTRDITSLEAPLRGAHFLFHAAAIKQVPSAEFFPMEATATNVLGSNNVLRIASDLGLKKVVCLSTDKAVYPINAMGISKALMEKTAIAMARANSQGLEVNVTRYGNVLLSRGSVVPHFVSQVKRGEPITITDPNMTRFLMTLGESVDLVLHALAPESGSGNIFVRKAPSSTIGDLAKGVSLAMGHDNYPTRSIGVRHGEKVFESLLSAEEASTAVDTGDYFRVPLDSRDLNYDIYFDEGQSEKVVRQSYTSHNTSRLSAEEVSDRLLGLESFQRLINA